ncbi:hypothetical protein GWK47_019011 [Chionoecetes opilio]|uniref:Peptidase M28 domain-containing protein n=1 Tax=Chionoecetes opilio TaxID=41210 RepID=A0A8J5CG60_CHIOP|nr:hypothetical protein GWK47_019011 [Chionoecetes opilio]
MTLLTVALLVTLAGTARAAPGKEVKGIDISGIDVTDHLEKLSESRYPKEENQANRDSVRDYIADRMQYYGLHVEQQKFNTTVNKDEKGITSEQIQVEGTNVIGIQRAVTKSPGGVIVVGADYDSNGVSDPMFRNGAGLAALLEVARLYTVNEAWSGRYAANYTTVFVAFDINTKLHQASPGQPGGHFFIREWLWPFIDHNVTFFGGAVILDSIMNVNYNDNSQTLSNEFQNLFPEMQTRVEEGGNKGDFLAMVSMGNKDDTVKLRDQFSGNYNKARKAERFRLEDMQLRNGMAFDTIVQQFVKSENIHFWTFKDENEKTVLLPAILLTDTATFRTDPASTCASVPCRPKDLLTEDRIEFVDKTVEATVHFLFSRQATLLPEQPSAASSLQSSFLTVAMVCLARLYM